MKISTIEARAGNKIRSLLKYKYCYYIEYDYSILSNILCRKKNGSHSDKTYSLAYIMLDTESSKDHPTEYDKKGAPIPQDNHLCAWTISIRAFHTNLCTLRGSKPSELMHCLKLIRDAMQGDYIYIFVHNLPWDWQFIRRFMFNDFGLPVSQLNIRSHYPITIKFDNGIILRDSLILFGTSLERAAINFDVEHKKVKQCWNYDLIRHQNYQYSDDELMYIEHDTLSGVECLNKLADNLKDTVISLPFTNTGIVRRHIRSIGRNKYAKDQFNKQITTYDEQIIMERAYHGGFTHANRHITSWIRYNVLCGDFKSSYPYAMLTCKAPIESWYHMESSLTVDEILADKDHSFIFKLVLVNPRMRDRNFPMPVLQFYKFDASINAILDNGRCLRADYIEITINEIDLILINSIYEWDEAYCVNVMAALNGPIPQWYRDEVFNIFKEKCELEYQIKVKHDGDMSLYNLCKARLNSLYGMCVTKPVKDDIIEVYEDDDDMVSGDYHLASDDLKAKFDKYNKDRNNILPYVYGIYVTSYAMLNLFIVGTTCIKDPNEHWLYSDTDSLYSDAWDMDAVNRYNDGVKKRLTDAGYGPVVIEDHEYWLGILEWDGAYDEFITQGAKRYATVKHGKIGITVAGVPKKAGACCLRDISDFTEGFIFYGQGTGKKTHYYQYANIHIDDHGNEVADSIDLIDADYTLSCVDRIPLDMIEYEEITIDYYEND